ncbi:MAG: nickel pincer cofactor biosynthesis protein LarC [Thermodesulforhabdaceae bacterium]
MEQHSRRFIYCDCFSGASGDMFLGALLDLGASLDNVNDALGNLLNGAVEVEIRKERRGSLWGTRALVRIKNSSQQHHRTYRSIQVLLEKSSLPDWVISKAIEIFRIIAEVESSIHNTSLEDVHFHEVGALDSIADIVGSLMALFNLGIYELKSSPLPMNTTGTIMTEHGIIPLPAPATLDILKGVPVYGVETTRELVTPTGAAILRALSTHFGPIPPCKIERIGYGVGSHPASHPPNMLRLLIASPTCARIAEELVVIEANIDDMPPELYEHAMEKLFTCGAMDVWLTPIIMKKNRPAATISVLCPPALKDILENILFLETTTAGVRTYSISRIALNRREGSINTPWGDVKVKVFDEPDGSKRLVPEYESCREISKRYGIPILKIYSYCFSRSPEDVK